jgi:hypothetical protein
VANQVNSCQNNDQLDALGEMYFLHYICTCEPPVPASCCWCYSNALLTVRTRENEFTRSLPPSPPECPSFETKRELVEHILCTNGEPSQCSEEAKRRVSFDPHPQLKYPTLPFLIRSILKALVRDGFRCIVTGRYDYRLLEQSTEVRQEAVNSNAGSSSTECVHIFPQSIAMISDIDDKDAKVWFADLSSVVTNHAYL